MFSFLVGKDRDYTFVSCELVQVEISSPIFSFTKCFFIKLRKATHKVSGKYGWTVIQASTVNFVFQAFPCFQCER